MAYYINNKLYDNPDSITFTKYGKDSENGMPYPLDGGTFELYRLVAVEENGQKVTKDEIYDTFGGDDQDHRVSTGKYVYSDLPSGTYYIKEINPPAGYLLGTTSRTDTEPVVIQISPLSCMNTSRDEEACIPESF